MSTTVRISSEAALRETLALADYYRNRNLILAEQLAMIDEERDALTAEVEALKAAATLSPAAEPERAQ